MPLQPPELYRYYEPEGRFVEVRRLYRQITREDSC
jgi:hypothetical protein